MRLATASGSLDGAVKGRFGSIRPSSNRGERSYAKQLPSVNVHQQLAQSVGRNTRSKAAAPTSSHTLGARGPRPTRPHGNIPPSGPIATSTRPPAQNSTGTGSGEVREVLDANVLVAPVRRGPLRRAARP